MANKKTKTKEKKTNTSIQKLTMTGYSLKPVQIRLISILMNPDDRRTIEDKCKEVGISRVTYYDWMKNPGFVKEMNAVLQLQMEVDLVDVYKSLKLQCRRGSLQAIRTYLEMMGKINNRMAVEHSGPGGGPIQTQNATFVFQMPEPPDKRNQEIDEKLKQELAGAKDVEVIEIDKKEG